MEDDEDDRDDWPVRRKGGNPFDPWGFPDIEDMMREMERVVSEQLGDLENNVPKNLVRESKAPDGSTKKEIGPIVYGYSVTIGPDGKPVIREFGNVKKKGSGPPWKAVQDAREPLVDVISSDKEVRVIAEMPGVDRENIEVIVGETTLTVSVNKEARRYYKQLELPGVVDPKGAKSKYNNGVLEVTIPLKSPKGSGVKLRVD